MQPAGPTLLSARARTTPAARTLFSADGKNVHAASRRYGTIASFAVTEDWTQPKLGENVPCGGIGPRNFLFGLVSSPPRFRISNQDSQNITSSSIWESGALSVAAKTTLKALGVRLEVISVLIRPPAAAGVGTV